MTAAGASAQPLAPPGEIVIYVNLDVRSSEFVEPLVCELSKVVQAPVRAKKIDIALSDDLLETERHKSSECCADDGAALVTAKVIKERSSAACGNFVSSL
jgi:hypothetical protein